MTVIDRDGRVFGRFNLVDAAVAAFVVLLLPVGYATYLLFRPARPVIDTVTQVPITNEERRVTGGSLLTAKLKVTGSGFSPLLRARIGSEEAMGLVFESPNSADVIVGRLPPGKHDLVLYDGVQEVARARAAVEIQAAAGGPSARLYGWIINLDAKQAGEIQPFFASRPDQANAYQILALGPVSPARTRIATATQIADFRIQGKVERAAEILVRCDPSNDPVCTIGGQSLKQLPPIAVNIPGLRFEIDEIAPPEEPTPAVVSLQLSSPIAAVKAGDHDAVVSTSAAEVTAVAGNTVTLKLGVHASREGWRYRGQLVAPGTTFTLRTESYVARGQVAAVRVTDQ